MISFIWWYIIKENEGGNNLRDLRIQNLANILLKHSVKLEKGENILIEILGEDGIPLAKELIKKSEELGAKHILI